MRRLLKQCLPLLLLLLLLQSTAMAAGEIVPYWDTATTVKANLTISNGTATCKSQIVGLSSVTSISGTMTLERKTSSGYEYVDSWPVSSTGRLASASGSHSVSRGYTYRLVLSAKVYKGSSYETVSGISTYDYP